MLFILCIIYSCTESTANRKVINQPHTDSLFVKGLLTDPSKTPIVKRLSEQHISVLKELIYDQYTLNDTFPYKNTFRIFQWDKIKKRLALLENLQKYTKKWLVLQNYKNRNGEAPLVKVYRRNSHQRITDTLGIERYQSIPLYALNDTLTPELYAHDGELAEYVQESEKFMKVKPVYTRKEWWVPKRYIKQISDTVVFKKAIFVDRTNQNIATLERIAEGQWLIRSMNPATTGRHAPPYAQETPLGIFVLQDKKIKMVFLKDGSQETGGYAPYASRFTDGAYIHGVPVNVPRTEIIEYSRSLGTTPRSHMCVRNASSHAKFIFEWAPIHATIIFVLE